MKNPKIKIHQVKIVNVEFATGHVLKTNMEKYLTSEVNAEVYVVFNSKDEGLKYMKETINNDSNIECSMWNYKDEHIITIDKDGERKYEDDI